MTAAPPADRAAATPLVAALEQAWIAIRRHHPDVPRVVIVVASGSDPRSRRLNLGHFSAGRWQLTDQPTDRPEVLAELETALVLWRRAEQATPARPDRSRNRLACSCSCGPPDPGGPFRAGAGPHRVCGLC